MTGTRVLPFLLVGAVLTGLPAAAAPQALSPADARRVDDIREALLRLPYYGVFDFLTFTYEKGTVVLGGYAYQGRLPTDAERAVKRVAGVDTVTGQVKRLSVSTFDDDIRWRVFYAIYTNAFLAKYAPGGGLLWGHRHPVGVFGPVAAFPGMQPVGNYPIHIIVEGGRVRLLGMVDSDTDKTVAGMAARGVSGTFGVENELVVDTRR
jgi:hyperosmotically inducible protein